VREWDYYAAPGGGSPVEKEMKKARLTEWEAGRLEYMLEQMENGAARRGTDYKPLRDGVWECLLDGHNRTFRLMYAEVNGGLVLLALRFISKKKQNDRDAVDLAVQRLREWRRRHE
jgi:phage-related protein